MSRRLAYLLVTLAWATPAAASVEQVTLGPCSPAINGSDNKVECGLDLQEIRALLTQEVNVCVDKLRLKFRSWVAPVANTELAITTSSTTLGLSVLLGESATSPPNLLGSTSAISPLSMLLAATAFGASPIPVPGSDPSKSFSWLAPPTRS